jgi:23S rRNA (guanine745-N1)-methyltransferase
VPGVSTSAHPFELRLMRCTVRGCGEPLDLVARALTCARGHAFDRARAGHVNLLQPQDRRAAEPGDPAAALLARERWFERGHADALVAALGACGGARASGAWLDLCCGTGSFTRALAPRGPAFGLDLSAFAIERAAKRDPARAWLVANADRGLPFVDGALGCVLAVQSRLPERELARVVAPGGRVIAVLPGARDQLELRERVLADARPLEHAERTRALFGAGWRLAHEEQLEARVRCDRAALEDALALAYRGQRASESARLAGVDELVVTQAWHVLELERC